MTTRRRAEVRRDIEAGCAYLSHERGCLELPEQLSVQNAIIDAQKEVPAASRSVGSLVACAMVTVEHVDARARLVDGADQEVDERAGADGLVWTVRTNGVLPGYIGSHTNTVDFSDDVVVALNEAEDPAPLFIDYDYGLVPVKNVSLPSEANDPRALANILTGFGIVPKMSPFYARLLVTTASHAPATNMSALFQAGSAVFMR